MLQVGEGFGRGVGGVSECGGCVDRMERWAGWENARNGGWAMIIGVGGGPEAGF